MPQIKPFRGVLYNPEKTKINDVVAPPYDVISQQQQTMLYDRNPHNIVRLILNRDQDPYSSAATHLKQWFSEHVLLPDSEPSIYVMSQQFKLPNGKNVERMGFIIACLIEEFGNGSIFPHEKTHSGPKADRLNLFQATGMMFSQIFGLYSDDQHILDKHISNATSSPPQIDVVYDNVRNQLWKLRDEVPINTITEYIRTQKVYIADGHHRYETALQYRNASRLKNPQHTGKEAYNFVPMFLTNMNDPGLVILPTHRLLHSIPNFRLQEFLNELEKYFMVDAFDSQETMLQKLHETQHHSYGLFLEGHTTCWLLTFRKTIKQKRLSTVEIIMNQLDVTILHSIIFNVILGMTDEQQEKKLFLEYEKDTQQAIAMVQEHKSQAAFIMNSTRIEQMRAVASVGTVMPQKSTYFYPKLLSGLVLYSFND